PHVTRVIRALLQPGTVMVDIGANIGYYTLLAAARIGSTGKVIAFEPNVDNCTLLHKSLQANDFANVVLYNVAVAEAEGAVSLHISDSNGSIVPDHLLSHPYHLPTLRLAHPL